MLSRVLARIGAKLMVEANARLAGIERDMRVHGARLKRLERRASAPPSVVPPSAAVPSSSSYELELPDALLPLALKEPAKARRRCETLARETFGETASLGTNVRVTRPLDSLIPIPHTALWSQGQGREIDCAMTRIGRAIEGFSVSVFDRHYGPNFSCDMGSYLRSTRIRVLALVEELRRRGIEGGTVLDLGSLFGAFSLPLQRLGFQVTAVDRYHELPGTEHVRQLLTEAGATIVATSRRDEEAVTRGLGRFDVVISMAVIEHIPHTPRLFLEMLRSHVRSEGILALDTPNMTRYWNRVGMAEGRSPMMDLTGQYFAEIPYEGHHREYTGPELVWMLQQVGGTNVRLRYVDYNMLQFEHIHRPHIECLLSIVADPTQADTILATAVMP